jgi:hypothetical protein
MDFDDTWTEPTAKFENKGKKSSLNPPQGVHYSSPKSLLSLEKLQLQPLANELPASSSPKFESLPTSPSVTNIKPPPSIFTDLWGDSDDSSSESDEVPLTNTLNPNQTEEEHQDMFVSEEKSEATMPLELDNMRAELWENDMLTSVETSEDWTDYAKNSFDELDLFDIDAVLEEQEEALQPQKHKRGRGASTWRQRLERWGGGVHVNWANKETAEWKVLEQLGYTRVPLSKETRDYIIQATRNAKLPHREKVQLTSQLANARAQLALVPPLNEEEREDPYVARRQTLQAEITGIEQILARKMQWTAIKKAVQFLGQGIELDDLMLRDNYPVRW